MTHEDKKGNLKFTLNWRNGDIFHRDIFYSEFERTGLVLEYFLETGGFEYIHTRSKRGLPRPEDDKYVKEILFADPVYAVWARKRNP